MPYKLKQFKVELIQLKGHWKWILFVYPYPWESKKRFNQIYSSRSHSCVTNPSEGINLKWKNMNEQTMVGLLNCFLSFSCAFAEKTAAKRFINANKMSGTFASFQHFTKLKFYHVHVKQLHTSWNKNSLLERGGGGGGGECTEMFVPFFMRVVFFCERCGKNWPGEIFRTGWERIQSCYLDDHLTTAE